MESRGETHRTPVAWEWERGPTGRLLKLAYTALRKRLDRLAREAGLTQAQWSAIGVLYHFPGATNSDLEGILLIERPSVTSLIKGMEARGWVVREDDPKDARSKRLYLTDTGKALAERTRALAERADQELLSVLTPLEAAQLRSLLVKLIERSQPHAAKETASPDRLLAQEGRRGVDRPHQRGSGGERPQPDRVADP